MKIAIISAMKEEINPVIQNHDCQVVEKINNQDVFYFKSNHEFYLLNTGVGKVNGAITTTSFIYEFKPDIVINFGTSGGLHPSLEIGDAVIASSLAFHDVDATGFGYEIGQVPGEDLYLKVTENEFYDKIIKILFNNVYKGLIVTGDQFIDKNHMKDYIISNFKEVYAAEMESAAIVKACNSLDTPVYVIRTISDLAYKESTVEFNDYLNQVSDKFAKFVEYIDE